MHKDTSFTNDLLGISLNLADLAADLYIVFIFIEIINCFTHNVIWLN